MDNINSKAYFDARLAIDKLNAVFNSTKSKDDQYVLNEIAATDKASASKFLSNYFDAAFADKLTAHYVTDKKADNAFVINPKSYFKSDLLESNKVDIKFDAGNTKEQVKFTTKDGLAVTMKLANDAYIVTDIQ